MPTSEYWNLFKLDTRYRYGCSTPVPAGVFQVDGNQAPAFGLLRQNAVMGNNCGTTVPVRMYTIRPAGACFDDTFVEVADFNLLKFGDGQLVDLDIDAGSQGAAVARHP